MTILPRDDVFYTDNIIRLVQEGSDIWLKDAFKEPFPPNLLNIWSVSYDTSPLISAVKKQYEFGVSILLKHGADANGAVHSRTPLYWAITSGNLNIIDLLLGYNANPNLLKPQEWRDIIIENNKLFRRFTATDAGYWNYLEFLRISGKYARLKSELMTQKRVVPIMTDMAALDSNFLSNVNLLRYYTITKDSTLTNALKTCIKYDLIDSFTFIFGTNITESVVYLNESLLNEAVRSPNEEYLQILLSQTNINQKDKQRTVELALRKSVEADDINKIKMLIEHAAQIDEQLIEYAREVGYEDVARLLESVIRS